jgi:hypothetical protein
MPIRTLALLLAATYPLLATAPSHAGFKAKARDFKCLLKGTKPAGKNFYVFHRNKKKLARAVAVAESNVPGEKYPVGTIIQLFPFEAMAKRGGRYNPEGHGWEFFQLTSDERNRSQITARGMAEVANPFGSCQGCHMTGDAPQFDLVCEGHGAASLPLTPERIQQIQNQDPRCAEQTPRAR